MLQLLVVFFAPYYVFGISTPYMYRLYAVIIGFSLNYAAYFAEIYRSGIQSIPQGQREAAQVMGYGRRQTFFRIIFPQMVKRVMPPVTNEVITLVKDTSWHLPLLTRKCLQWQNRLHRHRLRLCHCLLPVYSIIYLTLWLPL